MKNKFIILGCGNSMGVPRIDSFWGKCNKKNKKNIRTRCSAVIIKGSNTVLIDTSPDIRSQLIKNKVKNISSVVYSHEHADQTNGLFELRPFYWQTGKKINAYGDLKVMKLIKNRQDYLFKNSKSYPAIIKSNTIKSRFSLGKNAEKIFFKSIKALHGNTYSSIYVFEKTAYVSDCNDLSIIKMNELRNLKYLIIDCLKIKKHPSHFNLDESLYIHQKLKPNKTILTNLHYDLDYNFLLKNLPKNVVPAYDGLKISL